MGRAFEYRRAAKEKRWDKMSKVFPKLARSITLAVKEGGVDPDSNHKLRLAILNAKAQNMPKDNIDAAIKRASGKDEAEFLEVNYEGKGPHGVLFFIECASDNTNRTVSNLKTYFNKAGGQLVPSGSLQFLFDHVAVLEFEPPAGLDLEDLEWQLIDHGLEKMETDEGRVYVYGDYTNFRKLCEAAEGLGIDVSKAALERIPTNPMEFTEEQLEEIEKLIDRIEDDDDVQAVYTNIA